MSPQQSSRKRTPPETFGPVVETLEERSLLSCSIALRGRMLTITGDNAANLVEISDDGRGNILATCDDVERLARAVSRINIRTLGGDDEVFYRLNGDLTRRMIFSIDLGVGDDFFEGDLNDVAILRRGSIAATVRGGNGIDEIYGAFEGVLDGAIRLLVDGGNGDDLLSASATVSADDFSRRGRAAVTLRGGNGNDALYVFADDESYGGAIGTAVVDGGPGIDLCVAPPGARVINCESEDEYGGGPCNCLPEDPDRDGHIDI